MGLAGGTKYKTPPLEPDLALQDTPDGVRGSQGQTVRGHVRTERIQKPKLIVTDGMVTEVGHYKMKKS